EHGPRRGANIGRVQIDEPSLERKLTLEEPPECLVRAACLRGLRSSRGLERGREGRPAHGKRGRLMQELASVRLHGLPPPENSGTLLSERSSQITRGSMEWPRAPGGIFL